MGMKPLLDRLKGLWVSAVAILAVAAVAAGAFAIAPATAQKAAFTKAKALKLIKTAAVLQGESRYAENDPTPDTELTSDTAVVLDLAGSGQPLQLNGQRRVFASAVVRVRSGAGGTANGITCDINISGQDGQNSGENTPAQANFDLQLPLAESAVLGPGSHNVTVECLESAADMAYLSGQLQVWTG
jgi:hypothetical protein